MTKISSGSNVDGADRLSSEELAALVVDALLQAELLQPENLQRALKITTEEIEARKSIGDY